MTASHAPGRPDESDDRALTDIDRVLGYRGAPADEPDEPGDERLTRVGDELYCTPFWTPAMCAAVIHAAETIGAFEPQPDDPVPGHEVSLAMISPRLFEAVQDDIGLRIWPRLRTVWPYVDYHGLRDVFVIRYALGQQESLRIHHDVAQLSGSVKLNDQYEGGVLDFPRQGFTNENLGVGEMLIWPSLVTHPHQTKQLRSGVKYALTVWCELPNI